GDDLDLVADDLGQRRVEDGGTRVALDVLGHDRVLVVAEDALQLGGLGGLLHGCVDGLDRDLLLGGEGQDGDGAGRGRDAQRVAVQDALQLRQDQRDGLGGAGGGRDDVQGGGAGAAQVLVRGVVQALVAGVGVDGGHQATLDAELLVQDLRHRGEAVGGAGRVGDDVVLLRVVVGVVHADDEGGVLVLRRGGDDDLLGATVDVGLGGLGVGEDAGGLDDDDDADLDQRQVLRVTLGPDGYALAVDGDGLVVVGHLGIELAHDRVVLEQVGEGLVVGQVVDRHNLNVGALRDDGAEEVAPDAAEAVDAYTNRHDDLLQRNFRLVYLPESPFHRT